MGKTIRATEGDFDVELDIEGHATANARAIHRVTRRIYLFNIVPAGAAGNVADAPRQSGPHQTAARAAVIAVARANNMLIDDRMPAVDYGAIGAAQARSRRMIGTPGAESVTNLIPPVAGATSLTGVPPSFAFDTEGAGFDEGVWAQSDPAADGTLPGSPIGGGSIAGGTTVVPPQQEQPSHGESRDR